MTEKSRTAAQFCTNPDIAWQVLDDEAVLLNLSDGTAVGLNPTASHIWPMLGDHDENSIVASLIDEFEVSPETALADVRNFVALCFEHSLLVPPSSERTE
jgi:hypothetical protein